MGGCCTGGGVMAGRWHPSDGSFRRWRVITQIFIVRVTCPVPFFCSRRGVAAGGGSGGWKSGLWWINDVTVAVRGGVERVRGT